MKRIGIITALFLALIICFSSFAFAEYNEAPMLHERVESGELPTVEERLPDDPFVVGPGVLYPEDKVDWQVGSYGGTLHMAHHTPELDYDLYIMSNEPLVRGHGTLMDNVQGNIVSDFSVSEDNTEFTFYLREGLKWSDGEPVTTEDIRFAYEDVMKNEKLTPVFPSHYRSGGRPDGEKMQLEVVDDYTFKIIFDESYGAFITDTAIGSWFGSYTNLLKPSHYLKQFHAEYTDIEDMRTYLDEEELDDEWWELFDLKDITGVEFTSHQSIGFPVLRPWMRVEGPSGVIVFERNPYYFKVDTEGNQLPYIDELRSLEASEIDMVEMYAITGETDWLREQASLSSMPLYREHEERAGYRTIILENHLAPTIIKLNPTYEDEMWQELANDVRFRRALNMAIDREEIIDVVYFGLASPPETTPGDYNPEKAEQILDELGMDERDGDGFRLAPNGEQFEIYIEYADMAADFTPVLELVVEHFQEIGINTSMQMRSAELFFQKAAANELQASIFWRSQPQWHGSVNTDYLHVKLGS